MLYKDYGFRALYHNFCFFPLPEELKEQVQHYPGHAADTVTHMLTYGYIDQRKGLTLAVLCLGYIHGEDELSFYSRMDKDWVTVSIQELEALPFMYLENNQGNLAKRHKVALTHFAAHDASDALERVREMNTFDVYRHSVFPDAVRVYLIREGCEPEGCWVDTLDTDGHYIMGTLASNPEQDFGIRPGDKVVFYVKELEGNRIMCCADMNPPEDTPEESTDDNALKAAISTFKKQQTQQNLDKIFEVLKDSYVWIPCNTILSEEEQSHLEELLRQAEENGGPESLEGLTFQSEGDIRLEPDILSNGERFFFPVFTSIEEMGEYGEGFSKIEKSFPEAIQMAVACNRDLAGIVINAFSDPFVFESPIFDNPQ